MSYKQRHQCIITGCAFSWMPSDLYIWGDLFAWGTDTYVFNSSVGGKINPYLFLAENVKEGKVVYLNPMADIFQRNGIIIVAKADVVLSPAAREYLRQGDLL